MPDTATQIWQNTDRKRARFMPSIERATLQALRIQAKPIFDLFNTGMALEDIKAQIKGLIREPAIKVLIDSIFNRVGMAFADDSFHEITSQLKQDTFIESQIEGTLQRIIQVQAALDITAITETTRNWLSLEIQRYIEEGLSIPNAAKELTKRFDFISRARATMIARTEIISASNAGSLAGAESTGLPVQKIWLTARDKSVRDSHIITDGQKRNLKENFNVNGSPAMQPGDPKLPAGERVNCRCTIIYQVEGRDSPLTELQRPEVFDFSQFE